MSVRHRSVLCLFAVSLLLSFPAGAADCTSAYPFYYDATYVCDRTNTDGPCALSSATQFSIAQWGPYAASCATVQWSFGDGSPDQIVSGAETVLHTYAAAGTYSVNAVISTAAYPFPNVESFTLTVANGKLQWSGVGNIIEGDSRTVHVNRTNTAGAIEVNWSVVTDDDTPAPDLTPASGTVTLAAGQSTANILLQTTEDSSYMGDRRYRLRATVNGGFLPPTQQQFFVLEDDNPILDFANRNIVVNESDGLLQVTVVRSGDPNVTVSTHYQTSCCTNRIVPTSGTLVFAAGVTSRSFNVVLNNDAIWTGDTNISLFLSSPTGGARYPNNSFQTSMTFKLKDDDPLPTFAVSNIEVLEGDEGLSQATFTVTASQEINTTLFFQLIPGSAKPGSDYSPQSGFISFGAFQQSASIVVSIFGDRDVEADESFTLRFSNIGGPVSKPPDTICTIVNDDAGMGPAILRIPLGGTGRALLDIGEPAASPVVIPLSSSDPENVSVPSSVTIAAGSRRASFLAHGFVTGAERISATMPADRGGETLTIQARVYREATLAFDPSPVEAFIGQEIPVHVVMTPPPGVMLEIALTPAGNNILSVPPSFTLSAAGIGTFTVKALARGRGGVQMPVPDDSEKTVMLEVLVEDPATTPALVSLSPATGPAAGGTAFTAFGSHLTADCTLSFGGVPAVGLTITAEGTLTGVTPSHAPGTVDLDLTCGTSHFTLSHGFTYLAAPPKLSSITPAFGSTTGGTLVRAKGANFESGCWMFFGGVPASAVEIESTDTLIASAPARNAAGSVETMVKCGNEAASLAASFVYSSAEEPSASIISVDPLVGAPGQSVTITGSRFRNADVIRFDDVAATILRTRPDEHVVRIPELPLSMVSINMIDAGGRLTTTGPIFMVVEPVPPQITRATPSTVLPGSEISLEGSGFRPGYSFAIGGVPAQTIRLHSTAALIRLGETAPGTYPIHVLKSSQQVAGVGPAITVQDGELRLLTIAPPCGVTGGGSAVRLNGRGFAEGAVVTFNGVLATDVEVVGPTEIHAITPAGATGLAQVVVTNPNGQQAAVTGAFRYDSPFDPKGGCSTRTRAMRH
jgi:hypothetical protein